MMVMSVAEQMEYVRECLQLDPLIWSACERAYLQLEAEGIRDTYRYTCLVAYKAALSLGVNPEDIHWVAAEYLRAHSGPRPLRQYASDRLFTRPLECMTDKELFDEAGPLMDPNSYSEEDWAEITQRLDALAAQRARDDELLWLLESE